MPPAFAEEKGEIGIRGALGARPGRRALLSSATPRARGRRLPLVGCTTLDTTASLLGRDAEAVDVQAREDGKTLALDIMGRGCHRTDVRAKILFVTVAPGFV